MRIRAATRGSDLALWQTRRVASMLAASRPDIEVEVVIVSTEGDRDKTATISSLAGRGVFVKEVQAAVLDGRADIAVHSAKDLTSTTPDGLVLGAIPERASVEDGLVGSTLAGLIDGATIATGSVRRRAQLAYARPDLRFVELRGNMNTRLARARDADIDAIVVAAAGLERLDLAHEIDEIISTDVMLPQVAQGALAVECRDDDLLVVEVLRDIDDAVLRPLVETERAWLRELGSGCDLPVGGLARRQGSEIELEVVLLSLDGTTRLHHVARGPTGTDVVRQCAEEILVRRGGRELLGS